MSNKKYTVITGASSGIGYELAHAFSKRKKNLIIVARSEEKLVALASEITKKHPELEIVIKRTDLEQIEQVHALYDELSEYDIETWINNAGFGTYSLIHNQNIVETERMILLNIQALTVLSMYYVRDYKNRSGSTLINLASSYGILPTAVIYSATKSYVAAFTEGLAQELADDKDAKIRIKVFAPAKTKTGFGNVASGLSHYDYDAGDGLYNTSTEVARFLLDLYDSDSVLGMVSREDFTFNLSKPKFVYHRPKV